MRCKKFKLPPIEWLQMKWRNFFAFRVNICCCWWKIFLPVQLSVLSTFTQYIFQSQLLFRGSKHFYLQKEKKKFMYGIDFDFTKNKPRRHRLNSSNFKSFSNCQQAAADDEIFSNIKGRCSIVGKIYVGCLCCGWNCKFLNAFFF